MVGFALLGTAAVPAAPFLRGDVDGDGRHEITDAVRLLCSLFLPDHLALPCPDAADVDDSGNVTVADAVQLLNFLFRAGQPPAKPFPACGDDPTVDDLTCEDAGSCTATAVVFFGRELPASGIFYVLDRSPPHSHNGEFERARDETIRSVSALSGNAEFGIAVFDANLVRFPQEGPPTRATDELKAAATRFLLGITGGSGTCPKEGLLQALQFARASRAEPAVILFVSDGGGTCGSVEQVYLSETLETVLAENLEGVPVHTFGISSPSGAHEDFLRALAVRTGGTYTRIPLPE